MSNKLLKLCIVNKVRKFKLKLYLSIKSGTFLINLKIIKGQKIRKHDFLLHKKFKENLKYHFFQVIESTWLVYNKVLDAKHVILKILT